MSNLDDAEGYGAAKQMKNDLGNLTDAAIVHIREVTRQRFAQLLLARFLLLNLFVEEAQRLSKGLQEKEHRRLWVLLQAQPKIFGQGYERDIFMTLTNHLQGARTVDLRERIRSEFNKLHTLRIPIYNLASKEDEGPPFFCVLDEAQTTVSGPSGRTGEFMSNDNKTPRCILREIWLSWSQALCSDELRLVLSGTGIDYQALNDTLVSSACKECPYVSVHDIGAFDTPEVQAKYIKRYLPISDSNRQWREFLNRAWAWLRGR